MKTTQSLVLQKRLLTQRAKSQKGFIQAALLFGIALMTAVLGGFALANRTPTSQTDVEQAKVNASVLLKQASDLRDGVSRYASDFGASRVVSTMDFSVTTAQGLFDPAARYASPQVMPASAFGGAKTIEDPSALVAGHWHINKAFRGKGIGSSGADDPAVVITNIQQLVCSRVNRMLYDDEAIPASGVALATFETGAAVDLTGVAAIPNGWSEGCIQADGGSYVYYKVVQEN